MGRIVSGVRVSVSFRQKYPPGSVLRCPTAAENGVKTKGVVSGGFDLRLRRVTSSPSQTIRSRFVSECSARRRPSRLYFSHFATRTVYNTVDLYAVGHFTFWISLSLSVSLSPKLGLRPKISQKVKSFFRLDSAIR